ncbi:hypothetical protein [Desulfopila aestuarii]|uniref:Membrane fusion protein, multidrug efflux system n=1 Tax=Desulfopila aestuarii DSM 18488 TaxID=1121416 RepID=A0A1M7Y946_9BACT|nr:hypothetical protein [Desulfopila aestuarii]SHO49101.1 membrane fusion protein, multidrug efflux system [Desulfopila aestuarii DSM 18488]
MRRFLLLLDPLAMAAAASNIYLSGGRYVYTDNAYVQADKVAITAGAAALNGEITHQALTIAYLNDF